MSARAEAIAGAIADRAGESVLWGVHALHADAVPIKLGDDVSAASRRSEGWITERVPVGERPAHLDGERYAVYHSVRVAGSVRSQAPTRNLTSAEAARMLHALRQDPRTVRAHASLDTF